MQENNRQGKALVINCAVCDATRTKAEALDAYDQVAINAAAILVSEESAGVLQRANVSMNASQVLTVPAGCRPVTHNGSYTISGENAPQSPTALVVNGSLTIQPGAGEALKGYAAILVNGSVTCPESLSGLLDRLQVNGSTTLYPDGAVLLKRTFVVDKVFALRARRADYFAQRRVVLTDCTLDVAALAVKGVKFLTRQAIVAEPLLEAAIPLFGDEVEITMVPEGCAFVNDDLKLDGAALRKYGPKLYINGDLTLDANSKDVLGQVEFLRVSGSVKLPAALVDAFQNIDAEYNGLRVVKGTLITDRVHAKIGRDALEQESGVSVYDCATVTLAKDIPPQMIREKLEIRDCAQVCCTPEQRDAVEQVSQDVAAIQDGTGEDENQAGFSLGGLLKDVFSGKKKVVNAATYQL